MSFITDWEYDWSLTACVLLLGPPFLLFGGVFVDLQLEFARRVVAVEKLKVVQRASLAKLDALFASLQTRVFRGNL